MVTVAAITTGTTISFSLTPTKHEKWIEFLMQQQVPGSDPPMTFMELYDVTQKMVEQPVPKQRRSR